MQEIKLIPDNSRWCNIQVVIEVNDSWFFFYSSLSSALRDGIGRYVTRSRFDQRRCRNVEGEGSCVLEQWPFNKVGPRK